MTRRAAVLSLASGGKRGRAAALRLSFVGASPGATLAGESALAGKVNFLIGRDRAAWHTGVPTFGRVAYRGLWPGISAGFYGRQGRLEYDFDVAAGADPGGIGLALGGVRRVRELSTGELLLELAGGAVRQLTPHAYQVVNGARRVVASRYLVRGDRVGIQLGAYDHRAPLVIDPTLVYSTYLGGSDYDLAHGIAVDSSGAAYVTGFTASGDFPTTSGAYQTTLKGGGNAFVTKMSPGGGSLEYSTYLGGSSGDEADGIAVDSSGAAYVTGYTSSSDFPTTSGADQTTYHGGYDAFVTKLAPNGGSLEYSTYLGGSGYDQGSGIAVDSSGAAYVIGYTGSGDFPTTSGAYQTTNHGPNDAFVTKLSPGSGSLAYSTYLGGSGDEEGYGIAVDSSGAAYVTGFTGSGDFPTTSGAYQTTLKGGGNAFVTKLSPGGGSLEYSTYLGGSGGEDGYGIAVDSSGAAYVTGETQSSDFPTTTGAPQPNYHGGGDAFVTKLSPAGGSLDYSTYLGGASADDGSGIAVDSSGAAYVTGDTYSSGFPTTAGAYQTSHQGSADAFVTKLSPGGSLAYSTYLGGSSTDLGTGIAVDSSDAAYVAGYTDSSDFPATSGAYQTTNRGDYDAFVSKLSGLPSVVTGPAMGVTETSAQLTGSVNPGGDATSYYFEYGTTTGYGSQTASGSAGSGTSAVSVSAAISGLSPDTTYHYRLVAVNSSGTRYGADLTFTTAPLPPSAVTGSATNVRPSSAQLNGTVNPHGAAASYYFQYGTTTGYGSRTATGSAGSGTSAVSVSAVISGLLPGRTYHFRVVASNVSGTTYGADVTFTTALATLHLSVAPGRVRAGSRVCFSFRATSGGRGVSGVRIGFAGHTAHSSTAGKARICVALTAGMHRARATKHGYHASVAAVHATRPPATVPAFTG